MLLRYGEGNRSAIVAIEKTALLAAPRKWGGGGRLHPARPNAEAPSYSGGRSRDGERWARQGRQISELLVWIISAGSAGAGLS